MPDATTESNESDFSTSNSESEQANRLECPKCSKTFANYNTLSSHLSAYCGVQKRFECQYCLKRYKTNSILERHLELNCPEIKKKMSGFEGTYSPSSCSICLRKFANSGSLDCHLRYSTCGSSSRKFKCPHCLKNYKNESTLEAHKRNFHRNQKSTNNDASTDATAPTTTNSNEASDGQEDSAASETGEPGSLTGQQEDDGPIDLTNKTPLHENPGKSLKRKSFLPSTSSAGSKEEKHSTDDESDGQQPDVGEAQCMSGNATKSTKTDQLKEIEREQRLIEREKEETRLRLKLIECEKREEELTNKKKRLKSL